MICNKLCIWVVNKTPQLINAIIGNRIASSKAIYTYPAAPNYNVKCTTTPVMREESHSQGQIPQIPVKARSP
jgi:hypothetical protein